MKVLISVTPGAKGMVSLSRKVKKKVRIRSQRCGVREVGD